MSKSLKTKKACIYPTCGALQAKLRSQDADSIVFALRLEPLNDNGRTMAKYLSKLMQTRMNDDRYKPKVRITIMKRHMRSPAIHVTVIFQMTSIGITIMATSRSAMARCIMSKLILDFL